MRQSTYFEKKLVFFVTVFCCFRVKIAAPSLCFASRPGAFIRRNTVIVERVQNGEFRQLHYHRYKQKYAEYPQSYNYPFKQSTKSVHNNGATTEYGSSGCTHVNHPYGPVTRHSSEPCVQIIQSARQNLKAFQKKSVLGTHLKHIVRIEIYLYLFFALSMFNFCLK